MHLSTAGYTRIMLSLLQSLTIVILYGCRTFRASSAIFQDTGATDTSSRILVLGDIQQKDEFLLKSVTSFDRSLWDSHRIDTSNVEALDPMALIKALRPDDIFQVGDLVDFNNGFEIAVQKSDGSSSTLKPLYDEWTTIQSLLQFPGRFFPTIGNHETYKLVRFHATEAVDGTFSLSGGPNPSAGDIAFTTDQERHDTLTSHFPHLVNIAEFLGGNSGTYFAVSENYCLLSIEGSGIVNKRIENARNEWAALKPFLEISFAKCGSPSERGWMPQKPTIAMIHYPIFSALAVGEQEFLDEIATEVVRVFNQYRVALVLSGHEHLYMRYLDQGYSDAGYSSFLPLLSTYVTVSNFGVPENGSAKARGIGRTAAQNKPTRVSFQPIHTTGSSAEGNGSKFFLVEEPAIGFMVASKNAIKFVAKAKDSAGNWSDVDSFRLNLSDDGIWKRIEGSN